MEQKSSPITLPAAIIIAGALIAISVIWVKKPATAPIAQQAQQEVTMEPVSAADHIFGNPNARVKIVEYSDPSCPFCKIFHPIMKQILAEYGPSGDVAWVYRQFPIPSHVNSKNEANALECSAALGGNDVFWKYTDRLYEITPTDQNKNLDQAELPNIAKFVGLDVTAFNECLLSGRFTEKIDKQYADGMNAMLSIPASERGTPFSVLITPSGKKLPLSGAQTYAAMKTLIDIALTEQ